MPPTQVPDAVGPEVVAHLERAADQTAPFTVRLRGTGTFRPVSPVVFVGVVAGISSCEVLASRVRSGPLASAASFPYHPHVTIAHDLPDATLDRAFEDQAGFDASWLVTSFTVYEREGQSDWRLVRTLALRG